MISIYFPFARNLNIFSNGSNSISTSLHDFARAWNFKGSQAFRRQLHPVSSMDELPPWRGPKVQGSNKNLFKLWVSIGHSTVILPLFESFLFFRDQKCSPRSRHGFRQDTKWQKNPFITVDSLFFCNIFLNWAADPVVPSKWSRQSV